MFKIYYS